MKSIPVENIQKLNCGWISPVGGWYPCDYANGRTHAIVADAAVLDYYPLLTKQPPDNAQNYLLHHGWLRVDTMILPQPPDPIITSGQRTVLEKLLTLSPRHEYHTLVLRGMRTFLNKVDEAFKE